MSKKVLNLRTHSSEKVPSGSTQGLPGSTDLSVLARLVSSRACQSRRDEIPSNLCLLQKPQASERATHTSPPNCLLWTPSCYPPQPTKEEKEEGNHYRVTKIQLSRLSIEWRKNVRGRTHHDPVGEVFEDRDVPFLCEAVRGAECIAHLPCQHNGGM